MMKKKITDHKLKQKSLKIFSTNDKTKKDDQKKDWGELYTDGGARGNPGLAGYGFLIKTPNGDLIKGYQFLGIATNNQAEYHGLKAGLETVKAQKITKIHIFLDSELIVKQLKGEYKVKSKNLKNLYFEVFEFLKQHFIEYMVTHIPREQNYIADELANQAMDEKNRDLMIQTT